MLFYSIFKLERVSIMLNIWHLDFMHFLLPGKVGVVEIRVLTSICLKLGGCLYAQRVVLLNNYFGGRHVTVAFPFHIYIYIYFSSSLINVGFMNQCC